MRDIKDFKVDFHHLGKHEGARLVIGPRSHAADRFVPDFELAIIPSRSRADTHATMIGRKDPSPTQEFLTRKEKLFRIGQPKLKLDSSAYIFDLRQFGPTNWSHAMNLCFPVACQVRNELTSMEMPAPIFVVNSGWSSKLRTFFESMGLKILATNKQVVAPQISFEYGSTNTISVLVQSFLAKNRNEIDERMLANSEPVGNKIFLNRRGARELSNGAEICSMLEEIGYTTIYAEDQSLEQQMRTIRSASDIVALHGAALWPIGYRTKGDGIFRLTEIFHPAHVVPFFKHLCESLPMSYLEVKAGLTKGMVPDIYNSVPHDATFTQRHAADPFWVDPESLKLALNPSALNESLFGFAHELRSNGLFLD